MSYATFPAEAYQFKQISASGIIKLDPGVIAGIFVSAASSVPTIAVYDGHSASGTKIIDTFTPSAGQLYRIPAKFVNGLYVAIGGTVQATVFYL